MTNCRHRWHFASSSSSSRLRRYPLAGRLASLVNAAVPDGNVRDLLEGHWLGHVLHPVLSDVPIGTWTSR
jgi:hypothetical protein